jgi:endonuclease YncB( thermonuclease family)
MIHSPGKGLLIAMALVFLVPAVRGESLTGRITAILNADTVSVSQPDESEVWVRLAEIDLPEALQHFGDASKQALSDKLLGQSVRVEVSREDPFGRLIGHVHVGERWINDELVREGYAWHYKDFSSNPGLAASETLAREKAINLWAIEEPIAPWEFRKQLKHQKIMTIDAFLDERTRIPDPYDTIQAASVQAEEATEEEPVASGGDGTVAVPTGWLSRPLPAATATRSSTTRTVKKTTTPAKKTATRSRTTYGSGSK